MIKWFSLTLTYRVIKTLSNIVIFFQFSWKVLISQNPASKFTLFVLALNPIKLAVIGISMKRVEKNVRHDCNMLTVCVCSLCSVNFICKFWLQKHSRKNTSIRFPANWTSITRFHSVCLIDVSGSFSPNTNVIRLIAYNKLPYELFEEYIITWKL